MRYLLPLFIACTPVPDVNVYVDTTDTEPTDVVATDCPEPQAAPCMSLPLYCGGYPVELCNDERGHAAYVPGATESPFWCHDGDCTVGLITLMQWCAESF